MQTTTKQAKGAIQLKEISIIPITAAVSQPIGGKPLCSTQSMADDDSADSLRKKRCTDRYDSSESSDRWVSKKNLLILLAKKSFRRRGKREAKSRRHEQGFVFG